MQLVHDIYTLSVGNWIKFDATSNMKYLKAYPIPDIFINSQLQALQDGLAVLFNKEDINRIADSELFKTILVNNITLLESLYVGLVLTDEEDTYFRSTFKERYGRDFSSYGESLKIIQSELKKNKDKLAGFDKAKNVKTEEEISISELLIRIEQILGVFIDRNISVWEFRNYFNDALKNTTNV